MTSAAAVAQSPQLSQPRNDALRVFVAASFAGVAGQIADRFSARTGVEVIVIPDATSRLVLQLQRGASADLLLTADSAWMAEARALGLVGPSVEVARNDLVLVAPAPDRAAPTRDGTDAAPDATMARDPLELLRDGFGRLALAGEEVPAGRYAREALAALGIALEELPVATGGSVRMALEWVARGEARYGIVYGSDALAEPRVRVVHRFDSSLHTRITYPAAPTLGARAGTTELLDAFLAADDLLAEGGFRSPGPAPEGSGPAGFEDRLDRTGGAGEAQAPAPGPSLPSAILLSVLVAFLAVLVGTAPAVAVGRFLATRRFPGRTLVSALLLAPLVIPPVVTGFLLLSLFGASSPVGRALGAVGIQIPFTPLAAVLAATVVGLPLYAVVVRAAFQAVDRRYEELSWTLGVPPRGTFRRVVLPLALPGIAAGAVLAFARALGEFGATIVVAGNVEGETRTLPLAVYSLLETPGVGGRIWFFVGASVILSLAGLAAWEVLLDRQRRSMEDGRVG